VSLPLLERSIIDAERVWLRSHTDPVSSHQSQVPSPSPQSPVPTARP
jgi:hypothetical protein